MKWRIKWQRPADSPREPKEGLGMFLYSDPAEACKDAAWANEHCKEGCKYTVEPV